MNDSIVNARVKKKDAPDVGAERYLGKNTRFRKSFSMHDGEEETSSLWLITFTDAMALMLTFFVLMYSMSAPSEDKWEDITDGLYRHFNKYKSPKLYDGPQDTIDIQRLDFNQALSLNYLRSVVLDMVNKHEILKEVNLFSQKEYLIVSLPENLLFDPGQTAISESGKGVLSLIGGYLSNIKNRIEVVGHADPRQISVKNPDSEIKNNWELSLRRSMAVASILENAGYNRGIITRGFSSARYEELPEDWPLERKLNISRRVDVLIMSDDGNKRREPDLN